MESKRIQRKRTKGWRKPEGAVYVGRGTKWGNPFKVEGGWLWAIDGPTFDNKSHWAKCGRSKDIEEAVSLYEEWVLTRQIYSIGQYSVNSIPCLLPDIKKELKGKDLMCFCSTDSPCHADVLLKLANES